MLPALLVSSTVSAYDLALTYNLQKGMFPQNATSPLGHIRVEEQSRKRKEEHILSFARFPQWALIITAVY